MDKPIFETTVDLNKCYIDKQGNVYDEYGKIVGIVNFSHDSTYGDYIPFSEYLHKVNENDLTQNSATSTIDEPKNEETNKTYESPIVENVEWIDSETAKVFSEVDIVRIPEGIKEIGNSAFSHFRNMQQLILPSSLVRISSFAFHDCINLKFIEIPENVEIIDDHAFYYCENLRFVILPDKLKYVGSGAFIKCKNLKYIKKGRDTIFEGNVFNYPCVYHDTEIIFNMLSENFYEENYI